MGDEAQNIELRSEEVQEILGQVPRWIIRWGITMIFAVITLLLVGSFYFKYPDIIKAQVIITTENPPAPIVAMATGEIKHLFVQDNQPVKKDEALGVVDNPANFAHVDSLESLLDTVKAFLVNYDTAKYCKFSNNIVLGDIQASCARFLNLYDEYYNFIKLGYHQNKIESIKDRIKEHKAYYYGLLQQSSTIRKEFFLAERQYKRTKSLFDNKVISEVELEKSESAYLQKKYAYEGTRTTLANTKIQISQLEQEIVELDMQRRQQEDQKQLALREAYDNLLSSLESWKKTYLLVSPIDGKVTFTNIWSENQIVQAGMVVMTVVPEGETRLVGKGMVESSGIGKVKPGQKVNIKCSSFPHMEYGMVQGKVESISLVPEENFYAVEISLPDSLITNYGKVLNFTQNMSGEGEIITRDLSVMDRIMNPVRAILERQ